MDPSKCNDRSYYSEHIQLRFVLLFFLEKEASFDVWLWKEQMLQ